MEPEDQQTAPLPEPTAEEVEQYSIKDVLRDFMTGRIQRADPGLYKSRRMICWNECEHYWKITRQCGKCKCLVDLKAYMKPARCPVGKW